MAGERQQRPFAPSLRNLFAPHRYEVTPSNPAERLPSQPGALLPEQGFPISLPGANYPPAGAIPVDQIGDANLAPGATGNLLQVQVPDTLRLRISGIGFHTDDGAAIGFLAWRIIAFTDTIPGYTNMLSAIGSVRQLASVFIIVGSSALVTVQGIIDPTAVLTYRYACRIIGWFYTEKVVT
jgi:hypothetical protein